MEVADAKWSFIDQVGFFWRKDIRDSEQQLIDKLAILTLKPDPYHYPNPSHNPNPIYLP